MPNTHITFEKLNLIEPLLKAVKNEGYEKPTPIQEKAIPIVLSGRDLMGCAQTGTGKTAAFAIPMLQLLSTHKNQDIGQRKIRALVVTPTRELAIQIGESFASYGRFTGLKQTVIFGGVSQGSQVKALKAGIDVLVATPGRLLDLIGQGFVHLKNVEIFVLDEADRMLDMGFIIDVKKILKVIPVKRQSLFFSATMPQSIISLANSILTNPTKVEVTPQATTAETVKQEIYFVDANDKKKLLIHLLKDSAITTALVFTRTKHGANKVTKILNDARIKSEAIHGNKSQNARQSALKNFKDQTTRVLVATDIAARGIDIDQLAHVINYEIPNVPETYVHRIGRTGRAGANGTAISFCDYEEKAFLKDIQKLIGLQIPVIDDHPFPASNKPVPASQAPSQQRSRPDNNRRPQQGSGNAPSSFGKKKVSPWRKPKPQ